MKKRIVSSRSISLDICAFFKCLCQTYLSSAGNNLPAWRIGLAGFMVRIGREDKSKNELDQSSQNRPLLNQGQT